MVTRCARESAASDGSGWRPWPMSDARAAAVAVLNEVLDHRRSLTSALARMSAGTSLAASDRALVQELSYGVLRWFWTLEWEARRQLTVKIRRHDRDILRLILIGIYELRELRRPAHAVVSEVVNTCTRLHKPWTKGLVNAVLRGYLRRAPQAAPDDLQAETAHPQWLVRRLQRAWPDQWRTVIAANNARPPLSLRINRRRVSRATYLAALKEAGLAARPARWSNVGVILERPVPVAALPGFAAGEVSVQDVAAQWAGPLLDLRPGQRVLDACAAPGGKAAHALELEPDIELLALDKDAARLARLTDTARRLGLAARCVAGDARRPEDWHDGRGFDRILIDAPCSGSGVIRRRPDIKHLRRDADIEVYACVQTDILAALWPLLEPGGKLVYVTCSVLPDENCMPIAALRERYPGAQPLAVDVPVGTATGSGVQILPGEAELDGFFYAVLRKPE